MNSPDQMELSERAYQYLLEGLQDGTIRAGDAIARRQLATTLNMSLAPVNDAVMRLEAEGFLEAMPRRGTRVRVMTPKELLGQLLVREALEAQAARIYSGPIITKNRKAMEDIVRKMVDLSMESAKRFRLDMEFHRALVGLADSPVLLAHFTQIISKEIFLSTQRVLSSDISYRPADGANVMQQHLELIDNLCRAQPLEGDELIRRHIREGRNAIFAPGEKQVSA